jgi:hypothetical protein
LTAGSDRQELLTERSGNISRPHSAHDVQKILEVGESILSVYQIFCSSSRNLHVSVHRKVKQQQLHPCHIKFVKELLPKIPLQDVNFSMGFSSKGRKTLCLLQRVCSRINHASPELILPTFTTNTCAQIKILMRVDLTASNISFLSTCGLELQLTAT